MAIEARFNAPFEEQLDFFRGKVNIPTRRWDDLWREQHARGFMVAGAARDGLLSDFREAVDKAISQGTTLKEFQRDFDSIVKKHGWSYHGTRNWRSELIYDVNIRTSYQAGRYAQMTDPDVLAYRPYWEYVRTTSERPRPRHLAWAGTVLKADDPWWESHYPPNGWKCQCSVAPRSLRDLGRMGKSGPDAAPESPIDPKTGAPAGIDKGWDYNVGKAAWGETQAKMLMERQGKWKDLDPRGPAQYDRPEKVPADPPRASLQARVKPGDVPALRASLRQAIGGDAAYFTDPAKAQVTVNQAITAHIAASATRWDGREAYFPFIPELIEDPYEIWVGFARNEESGRVAVRRKYVKVIDLGRQRTLGLYAEFQDGVWISGDMFRGGMTGVKNLRKGHLVYGR